MKKQKELEVNTQMQDSQNMLLKTLSGILKERKMSFKYCCGYLMKENMLQYVCHFPQRLKNIVCILVTN